MIESPASSPSAGSSGEATVRRAELLDRLEEMEERDRRLFWTVPITSVLSTLVMDPSGLVEVVLFFSITMGILSLFAGMVRRHLGRERREVSRELDELERRIEQATSSGTGPSWPSSVS